MQATTTRLDEVCINTLRTLAMDAVQLANSGHPGTPMGAATIAYVLWTRFLRHNPGNPKWTDRDRFVLSPGHASILLYSILHLTGYGLTLEDLKSFRQWGSRTPGHPEYGHTPGVELTTGPLGAGFSTGVGFAIAERFLANQFNRPGHTIVDHHVYGIVSDGDMMEGVSSEAASLAGNLGLGKLIYLYDDNGITIEGTTEKTFTERVGDRFDAYGWHVQRVDGNNVEEISQSLERAKAEESRPSLIIARTEIAHGSPHLQGSAAAHGAPLGEEEVRLTKQALGWPEEPSFYVPEEALQEFRKALGHGHSLEQEWDERFARYRAEFGDEARLFTTVMSRELPPGWDRSIPDFAGETRPMATRVASGRVLNGVIDGLPTLVGGSADLAPSTETYLRDRGDLGFDQWNGHNLHFGVREHAMGNIVNGMALHGGVTAYGGTFLVFSDYMRPAIRLAALEQAHSLFVFTHDSIGLGQDGPTHQPIEHLAALRAIPGLTVLRPADAHETAACWRLAIERDGPSAIVLTRQALPILDDGARIREGVPRGAYVIAEADGGSPDVILLATGSEVSLSLAARDILEARGVHTRVVSMPSWEVFEEQPPEYRDSVLPPSIRARLAIEAASPMGWRTYTGDGGDIVGLDHFGASAPGEVLFEKFGFTPEVVAARAEAVAARSAGE